MDNPETRKNSESKFAVLQDILGVVLHTAPGLIFFVASQTAFKSDELISYENMLK